jgi:hypothetical protein
MCQNGVKAPSALDDSLVIFAATLSIGLGSWFDVIVVHFG